MPTFDALDDARPKTLPLNAAPFPPFVLCCSALLWLEMRCGCCCDDEKIIGL